MEHCKKYETHNDYITAKNIGLLVKHNVSYCQDNKGVHYDPDYDQYYSTKYLSFEAIDSGTFTFRMSLQLPTTAVPYISYSVDGGETWVRTNNIDNQEVTVTTPVVNKGAVVIWKSEAVQFIYNESSAYPTIGNGFGRFSSSVRFNVYGNIMSLMYGDDFENKTILKNILDNCYYSGSFGGIFATNSNLISASNLILPATTLNNAFCYYLIFYGCTSLTEAPELPATTLAESCYYDMFHSCTALTVAPELPATTLANGCYQYMFLNCTSLTTAPELPATSLANYCYQYMFLDCTSLTAAPELPATTLATNCYQYMFYRCISLTAAPELPAATLALYCYGSMFYGCRALTAAPELPATTLVNNCYSSMFLSCRALTAAPELPATTLANYCYFNMFRECSSLTRAPELPATTLASNCYLSMFLGCTSLTTAPELPVTTLTNGCYRDMFLGCSNLNYIKAMFTTTPSTSYTNSWVSGVSPTGTFVKNVAASWNVTGDNGIPSGWTVQTATA